MAWFRSTVAAWDEPSSDSMIDSPQDAVDRIRATVRACQRALHGPFYAAGDAVLLERGIDAQLRRAVARAGELAGGSGWFAARMAAYAAGHEWVDGHRVRRDRVPDQTDLLVKTAATAATAASRLRDVVRAIQPALEPWPGMRQSCMTREVLANINDALLAYDAAASEHYRVFAAFRAARTAEIERAWRVVPTEPDIPVFQPPGN